MRENGSSFTFVVGVNDGEKPFDKKGKPYPVVHIESCDTGRQIGTRRRFFADFEEARAFASHHRAATCCKTRIERQLRRQVP